MQLKAAIHAGLCGSLVNWGRKRIRFLQLPVKNKGADTHIMHVDAFTKKEEITLSQTVSIRQMLREQN